MTGKKRSQMVCLRANEVLELVAGQNAVPLAELVRFEAESYTVEEVARQLGTHKNTVRAWVKAGLPTSDGKRPMLILGVDLAAYLQARRKKNKRPCQPGEIYCVRCRAPKQPAGDMAEYQSITEQLGNLEGICPDCDLMIYRRASMAKLAEIRGKLDISFTEAQRRVIDSDCPTVNSDLE